MADIKSEPRPASNRNRWPASDWNAWPASSESARRWTKQIREFEGSLATAHETVLRPCIRWARTSPNHDAAFASAPGSGAAVPIWKTAWKPRHVTGCRCLGLVSPAGGKSENALSNARPRGPHLQAFRRFGAHRQAPERDQQLARERHDQRHSPPTCRISGARPKTTNQSGVLLKDQEGPCKLDHAPANSRIAGA